MEKPEINTSTAETIPQKETTQNQMDKKSNPLLTKLIII